LGARGEDGSRPLYLRLNLPDGAQKDLVIEVDVNTFFTGQPSPKSIPGFVPP